MLLIKFHIILSAILVGRTCLTKPIIHTNKLDVSTGIVDGVVSFLERHYEKRGKAAGLVGCMPEILYKKLSEKLIPVSLLDDYRPRAYKTELGPWELHKLDVFVLSASSIKQFSKTISLTKVSNWRNSVAHHLIVNWSSAKNNGCIGAATYLYKAWTNNMIDTRYLCQNGTDEWKLYGYNPYTDEAPKPWQLAKVYSKKEFHPFAVFSCDYRSTGELCETVGADTIKKLAGYKRYILQERIQVFKGRMGKGRSARAEFIAVENVFHMLASTLNATLVDVRPSGNLRHQFFRSRKYFVKVWIAILAYLHHPTATVSYPVKSLEMYATTHFRGHLTQLQKILSVTDISSRIGLCLVLLLTLLFFKYFLRHSFMQSLLNVFRIVCDTSFENIPNNLSTRLYIGPVLLFAVVMQGIYQGNLAAFLTKTLPIKDPATKQDLADLGYTVYAPLWFVHIFFDGAMFDKRLITIEGFKCERHMAGNSMAACVSWEHYAKDLAWELKYHVVGERMGVMDIACLLPIETHLEERINKVFQAIKEADIDAPLYLRSQNTKVSDFEFDEAVKKNKNYKAIALDELEFAFVILGIGLACATVTFIGELVISKYCSRIQTTRIRYFN